MPRRWSISDYPPPPSPLPRRRERGSRGGTSSSLAAARLRGKATAGAAATGAGDATASAASPDWSRGGTGHDDRLTLVDATGNLGLLVVGETNLDWTHLGGALAGLNLNHLIAALTPDGTSRHDQDVGLTVDGHDDTGGHATGQGDVLRHLQIDRDRVGQDARGAF